MDDRKTIEEWQEIKQTPPPLIAGMRMMQGWKAKKSLSEDEFDNALEQLSKRSQGGGLPVKQEVKTKKTKKTTTEVES